MARRLLFTLILLVLAGGTATPHGGAYRGPTGEFPPGRWGKREPPVPPPPRPATGKPAPPPVSLDSWVFWWAYNKDALLPEPRRRAAVSEEAVRKRVARGSAQFRQAYRLASGGVST